MSAFDTDFAAMGAPALHARFGRAVTYLPFGGGSVALTAAMFIEQTRIELGDGRHQRTAQIQIASDDVATPTERDRVTVGSDTWSVRSIESLNVGGLHTLDLVLHATSERTQDGYRGRR